MTVSKYALLVRLSELQTKAANRVADIVADYEGDTLLDGDVEDIQYEIVRPYYEEDDDYFFFNNPEEAQVYQLFDEMLRESTKRYIKSLTGKF